MRLYVRVTGGGGATSEVYTVAGAGVVQDQWRRVSVAVQQTDPANNNVDGIMLPTATPNPGPQFRARRAMMAFADTQAEALAAVASYFDGNTPNEDDIVRAWSGAESASISTEVTSHYDSGDAQVIDRFFLDPTHPGVHLTIYYTEAVGEPSPEWYAEQVWQPILRDYRLQKGFVHIPPTAARHFKFEFTALAAEPHETMLPLTRPIRLFPQTLIDATLDAQGSASSLPGGLRTAIEVGDNLRYADALRMLRDVATDTRDYLPTEAMYASDPQGMVNLREQSWAFGWTPWHQGSAAPRWLTASRHAYDVIEMRHTTKVGFFVGLRDIEAFRTDPGQDDDTLVYDEHFHDFRDIEPGFTWTFNPGALETVLDTDCVATSRVYGSRHNVWAIQFATQQTAPVQVVPDDDLRDPALAAIDWTDNPDGWHQVGDTIIVYSPVNHSARLVRYSQPLLRPTPDTGGLVQEPLQEVFSYRPWAIADATQTAASWGGIETPLVGVSSAGQVYVAVRFTFLTPATSPLVVQVLDGATEAVLMEYEVSGGQGEIVEKFFPFPLSGSAAVRARVIQRGISDDTWEIDRLSIYDPGIMWEFSVDGGVTWVPAEGGVRNNAYGFVTFPEPGNQLMWRVTGMRPRMSVSSLRMRVHYLGLQNARYDGAQRGPNVSVYDEFPPITEDPMFTTWSRPVPRDWFMAYRQFPMLVSADGPTVTEFARFYGRPVEETVTEPSDVPLRMLTARRAASEVAWVNEQVLRTNLYHAGLNNTLGYNIGTGALQSGANLRGFAMPVTPGAVYRITRSAATNRFYTGWHTELPVAGSVAIGGVPGLTNHESVLTTVVTAPAGATHLQVYLSNASEAVSSILVERGEPYGPVLRTNLCVNPSFSTGVNSWTRAAAGTWAATGGKGVLTLSALTGAGTLLVYETPNRPYVLGQAVGARVQISHSHSSAVSFRVSLLGYNSGGANVPPLAYSPTVSVQVGQTVEIVLPGSVLTNPDTIAYRLGIWDVTGMPSGTVVSIDNVLVENVSGVGVEPGAYFDGTYFGGAWTGTANASTSTLRAVSTPEVGTYFDGSTPAEGSIAQRWNGTANASTSTQYQVVDPAVAPYDTTVRKISLFRGGSDVLPEPTDSAYALILPPNGGIIDDPMHPPL